MRKLLSRWNLIVVLLLVCAVAFGGYYFVKRRAMVAARTKNTGVATGTAKKGNLVVSVDASGTLEISVERTVLTSASGTVDSLLASEGDTVAAGQVLAQLTNDSLKNEVEQCRIDLLNAQNKLSDLLNPSAETVAQAQLRVKQAEITLQTKRLDQKNLRVTAPISGTLLSLDPKISDEVSAGKTVASLQDDQSLAFVVPVPQDKVNGVKVGDNVTMSFDSLRLANPDGDYHRSGKVIEIGQTAYTTGGKAVIDVTVSLDSAEGLKVGMTGDAIFRLSNGKTTTTGSMGTSGTIKALSQTSVALKVSGEVSKINVAVGDHVTAGQVLFELSSSSVDLAVEQAANDLEIAKSNYNSLLKAEDDTAVRDQKLKVTQAQSSLDAKLNNLAGLTVVSPVSGVVLSTYVNAGDKVSEYAKIAVVAETGKMSVDISVDELDIAKVKIGQVATVTASALSGSTFTGKVVSISPAGTSSNGVATFGVTVEVDKPTGLLSGMSADVNIVVESKADVLLVPAEAIIKTNGKSTVLVMSPDGTSKRTEVTVGSSNGSFSEILSGLNEGDSVVLASVSSSTNGNAGMFMIPGGGGDPRTTTITRTR